MQEAIRPVSDQEPMLQGEASPIRPAVENPAGSNAGLHKENPGPNGREGNQKRPYGFWHYAKPYKVKRFNNDDEAWNWAVASGYRYDGRIGDKARKALRDEPGDAYDKVNRDDRMLRENGVINEL